MKIPGDSHRENERIGRRRKIAIDFVGEYCTI
jgi:hypothetical protein